MFRFLTSSFPRAGPPSGPGGIPPGSPDTPRPGRRIIDVEGMLRQASTRVSVDHLIKKGKKYIQVLSRDKIDELINRSVHTIVAKHRLTAAHRHAASAAQIEAESKAEFQELLQQYQQTADAKSAVENSKRALEEQLEEIRFELVPDTVQKEAANRGDLRAESNGALEDFIRTLDKQVLRMFAVRKTILERSASPEAISELSRVEDLLHGMLAKIIQIERDRFTPPAGDVRELAMLRKRMDKLTTYTATLEAALKTLSTSKTFSNQQVQNLLRDLGLAPDDQNFAKKKEMLKVVLSATLGIRKKARELAARGITLDAPEEQAVFTPATEFHSDLFSRSPV